MIRLRIICLIVSATLFASTIVAQQQVNTQVNRGNRTATGYGQISPFNVDPSYRTNALGNNIITGNVSGLGYFHGDVGYRSPRSFQGELGSDDLFRFHAVSYPSAGGYQLGQSYAQPTSVYRASAGTTGLDIATYNRLQSQRPLGAIQPGQLFKTPAVVPTTTLTSRIVADVDSTVGLMTLPDGTSVEMTASPLFGVTQWLQDLPQVERPARVRTDEQVLRSDLNATEAQPPQLETQPFMPAVSMEIGAQLQAQQFAEALQLEAADTDWLKQRVGQIEQAIFVAMQEDDVEAGDDAYVDLLTQIKQQADAESQTEEPPASEAEKTIDPLASAFDPPTRQAATDAERDRVNARRKMLGLPELIEVDLKEKTEEDDQPQESKPQVVGPMAELLEILNYDLPRVKTLAGEKQNKINQWKKDAEQAFIDGDFFKAEKAYRRILVSRPNDPLARVGLIHAQLGAGLIRTATYNLRRLFEQYPHLIAAQYDASLLPPPDRLAWLRDQLDTMITRSETRQDPALAMAYLGYQTGVLTNVAYGLDIAEARRPDDPLIPLLRSIWLDNVGQPATIKP